MLLVFQPATNAAGKAESAGQAVGRLAKHSQCFGSEPGRHRAVEDEAALQGVVRALVFLGFARRALNDYWPDRSPSLLALRGSGSKRVEIVSLVSLDLLPNEGLALNGLGRFG